VCWPAQEAVNTKQRRAPVATDPHRFSRNRIRGSGRPIMCAHNTATCSCSSSIEYYQISWGESITANDVASWVPILASYPFQLVMHEWLSDASVSTRKVDPSVYSPVHSAASVYTPTVIDVGDVRAMHACDADLSPLTQAPTRSTGYKSAAPRALASFLAVKQRA
jgi:hypothetical protein